MSKLISLIVMLLISNVMIGQSDALDQLKSRLDIMSERDCISYHYNCSITSIDVPSKEIEQIQADILRKGKFYHFKFEEFEVFQDERNFISLDENIKSANQLLDTDQTVNTILGFGSSNQIDTLVKYLELVCTTERKEQTTIYTLTSEKVADMIIHYEFDESTNMLMRSEQIRRSESPIKKGEEYIYPLESISSTFSDYKIDCELKGIAGEVYHMQFDVFGRSNNWRGYSLELEN